MFSGQATSMKHSISRKFASFDGVSFPTEMVYDFLCFEASSLRRWVIKDRYDAIKIIG